MNFEVTPVGHRRPSHGIETLLDATTQDGEWAGSQFDACWRVKRHLRFKSFRIHGPPQKAFKGGNVRLGYSTPPI